MVPNCKKFDRNLIVNKSELGLIPIKDGQVIYIQDTGEIYADKGSIRTIISALTIPVNPTDTSNLNIWIETGE